MTSYPLNLHGVARQHEDVDVRRVAQNLLETLKTSLRIFVDPSEVVSVFVADIIGQLILLVNALYQTFLKKSCSMTAQL